MDVTERLDMFKKVIPYFAMLAFSMSSGCPSKEQEAQLSASEVESEPQTIQEEPPDTQGTQKPANSAIEVGAAFLPLKLGMAREQVLTLFPGSIRIGVMVHPSQFAGGYEVASPNGKSFVLAFDEDDRVRYISTDDKSAELSNGVKPGTAFAEVKEKCPNCYVGLWPGYGTMVEISETERAVFSYPIEPPIFDVQVVDWIELRSTEASGWASAGGEDTSTANKKHPERSAIDNGSMKHSYNSNG